MRVALLLVLAGGCEKAEVVTPEPATHVAFSSPDFVDAGPPPVDAAPPPDARPLTRGEIREQARIAKEMAKAERDAERAQARQAKIEAAEECTRQQALRQKIADNFESLMLEDGQDLYANARGKCGTTLSITWIGCGRPFVHQLQNGDGAAPKAFRDVGFTKVVCNDGYYATVSGDL